MEERLQKILSHAGIASRRAAEALIRDGRVTVDGVPVTMLGSKYDPSFHEIAVDGTPVQGSEEKLYILLHKPRGCLSTAHDDRGRRTVLDLLPHFPVRLYPVGRLDAGVGIRAHGTVSERETRRGALVVHGNGT